MSRVGRTWFERPLSSLRDVLQNRAARAHAMERIETCEVMVLSKGKSGRTWLRAILTSFYTQRFGFETPRIINGDNLKRFDARIPSMGFSHDVNGEVSGRARLMRSLQAKKLLLLLRDPRDVSVSSYFHMFHRHSAEERRRLGLPDSKADLPMFDFLVGRYNGSIGSAVAFMNRWHEIARRHPRSLTAFYEALHGDPEQTLGSILDFLGTPALPDELAPVIRRCAFDNLQRLEASGEFLSPRLRPFDPGDPDSFKVRRGVVHGYRNYLTSDEIQAVDRLVEETLNAEVRRQLACHLPAAARASA